MEGNSVVVSSFFYHHRHQERASEWERLFLENEKKEDAMEMKTYVSLPSCSSSSLRLLSADEMERRKVCLPTHVI